MIINDSQSTSASSRAARIVAIALFAVGAACTSVTPTQRPSGDIAALEQRARAAAESGNVAAALASYRDSLARFRALRYTEAREQALYELRAWRRRVGPGETARQIGAILADEPEKRYVARFSDRKPDWNAFEDAKIEGYKRAQHRFIGAGGSGYATAAPW